MNSELISYNFLSKEVRNGYEVSSEMKKIWAVELDLLAMFMRVCKKNNISFFASGGTLLGAVRHNGFIPWDDDIDIMMFRKEYEKLLSIAQEDFCYPYFLQTEYSDPKSCRGHAQLRNSNTTAILKNGYDNFKKINQGCFIDIFPLDNIPNAKWKRIKYKMNVLLAMRQCKMWLSFSLPQRFNTQQSYWKYLIKFLGYKIFSIHYSEKRYKKLYKKYERCLTVYKNADTEEVILVPFFNRRSTFKKKLLLGSLDISFEMLRIPIPIGYEKLLEQIYGDWHSFVVGENLHGDIFFDVNNSYTKYINI